MERFNIGTGLAFFPEISPTFRIDLQFSKKLFLADFTRFFDCHLFGVLLLQTLFTSRFGESGGSVVERRTPEREVGEFETYLRRVVSLSKTLSSQKLLVIPWKRWLRPDMTEKLLFGTSSLNTNKTSRLTV